MMSVLNAIADWWKDPNNATLINSLALPVFGAIIVAIIVGIWKSIIKPRPNSARDKHRDPKGRSKNKHQLYYPNLEMKAVGFDGILSVLNKFLRLKDPYLWCLVTGEGGTGKSKLCYDFMRSKERKWWRPWGWEPCMPGNADKNFTKEVLDKCKEHLPRKTLFILDYAEYNTTEIRAWMISFTDGEYSKKKIRVILIQRRESTSKAFDDLLRDGNNFNDSPISLNDALDEKSMTELIDKYIKKHKKRVTQSADDICKKLVSLDKKGNTYFRPLYALMLVDALAENREISGAEDVLKYIYGHEENTIEQSLKDNHYLNEDCIDTALILYTISTMIGRIHVENTCRDIKRDIPEPTSRKDKRFSEISIFDNGLCKPVEPDIIGAYFVLKCIERYKGKGFEDYISYAWRHDENRYMRGFLTRLMQECNTSSSAFDSSKLSWFSVVEIKEGETEIAAQSFKSHTYIKKLIIPASIKHIRFEALNDCVKLEEVVFADNSLLETIGTAAFYGCSSLKSINLPCTLTSIGSHAFEKCPLDGGVTVPASIKRAGKFAFFRCSVAFPDGFDEALKTKLLGGETLEFGGMIWDVLDEREYKGRKQKLIITHDVIDKRAFDAVSEKHWLSDDYAGTDWHDCSLRAYLNSSKTVREYSQPDGSTSKIDFSTNGFLSRVTFTPEGLRRICPPEENGILFTEDDNRSEGYVSANKSYVAPIDGKETIDKIFLLSTKEAKRYYSHDLVSAKQYLEWCHDNGFDLGAPDEEFLSGQYCDWFPNEFPISEDLVACDGKETWNWWLRSSGLGSYTAAYVRGAGHVRVTGYEAFREWGGVRPALWLNL